VTVQNAPVYLRFCFFRGVTGGPYYKPVPWPLFCSVKKESVMYCYSPVRTLLPLKPVRFNGTCGFSVFLNYNFVCYLHRYTVKSPVFGSQLNVDPNVITPTTEVSNFVNAVAFASKYLQLCSKNLSPFPSLVLMLDSNIFGRLTAKNRMKVRSLPCSKSWKFFWLPCPRWLEESCYCALLHAD
jgi:hypothetical protein